MAKMFIMSLCLSEIVDNAKQKHPAFTRGNNGKTYFRCVAWINDKNDQYGNIGNIRLNQQQGDQSPKIYIGGIQDPETFPKDSKNKGKGSQSNKQDSWDW